MLRFVAPNQLSRNADLIDHNVRRLERAYGSSEYVRHAFPVRELCVDAGGGEAS